MTTLFNSHSHSRAFTLIEILVALFIFAIMGVLAAMSLHSMIRTHEQLKKSDQQLLQLQITMTLLRRDIMQVIDRKIRDASGDQEAAFIASGNKIEFTRAGSLSSLFGGQQSDMQRIGYVLQGDKLARVTWDVLDQAPHSQSELQVLLTGVQSLKWQFITDQGKKSDVWPPVIIPNKMQKPPSDLPAVVLLVMDVKGKGVIQGVFPVPARGLNAAMQTQTKTTSP